MSFKIKPTKGKASRVYKSLYLSEEVAERIAQIAADNDTSFNNVVISMIEYCLDDLEDSSSKGQK